MNAIVVLERQHQAIKQLFEATLQATEPDEKLQLFEQLADTLAAHSIVEEEIFYVAAFRGETDRLISRAVGDHLEQKILLSELMQLLPQAEGFAAKLELLRRRVDEHVNAEERQLFEEVEAVLDEPHLEQLGHEIHHRFEEEICGEPSERLIAEVATALE